MSQYSFAALQPGYAKLWAEMTVIKGGEASRQARAIIAHKDRYQAVEATTGIPWFVVGLLNMREDDGSFTTWLHNGDPMRRNGRPVQTVHVPAHRPPNPDCTWEQGAYDALVTCEHLNGIKVWSPEHVAYCAEGFNGWGYRNPRINIPSPYLWGGTSVQKRGKFDRDRHYDAAVMDDQIGVMAVLKQLMTMDDEITFDAPAPVEAAMPTFLAPEPAPSANPKAIDAESAIKALHKSKTIWGGILGYATTAGTALSGLVHELHDPYVLAVFLAALGVGGVGLYLVVKGRVDINAIVHHLADDDS